MTSNYVKNRLPSPRVVHKTPFEIAYNLKPSVKHTRVFGCQTYILTPKEKRLKWDAKARAGVFVGYEEVLKAYRVYDIETGQVVISRDVTFDESTFGLPLLITDEDADDLDFELLDLNDEEPRLVEYKQTGKRKNRLSDEDTAAPRPRAVRQRTGLEKSSAPESNSSRQEEDEETKDSDESTPPVFCCAKLESTRLRSVFCAAKLPNGQRAIVTKWVFKIKLKAGGSIEKYKERLVARGSRRKYGIDYTDTFSPVYCVLTVEVLLSATMGTVNLSKSIPRNYGEF
uniref:Reverse transcriptase Ty1/copia-type domain-containing protein n=1 Tax=Peronospora matthiolae TaxID=2874970 RepID=A0AAV1TGK1_9STRA